MGKYYLLASLSQKQQSPFSLPVFAVPLFFECQFCALDTCQSGVSWSFGYLYAGVTRWTGVHVSAPTCMTLKLKCVCWGQASWEYCDGGSFITYDPFCQFIICLFHQKVCWDDEFRGGTRLLRNVGKLNFPSPSNEVSGLGCGLASPDLGRRDTGRKEGES